jgi:hypothetical protein
MEQSPWETSSCTANQISLDLLTGTLCQLLFYSRCATCLTHHILLDFYKLNNVGQGVQLLKFLITEFLSKLLLLSYAQIFLSPTLPSKMAPVIWEVPHSNLLQDTWPSGLAFLMWMFLDCLSLKAEALQYIIVLLGTTHPVTQCPFPKEVNLQVPCFHPNSQKEFSCLYLTGYICSLTLLYSDAYFSVLHSWFLWLLFPLRSSYPTFCNPLELFLMKCYQMLALKFCSILKDAGVSTVDICKLLQEYKNPKHLLE